MVSSGDKKLEEFDRWWTKEDQNRIDKFFPRDFMMYDNDNKKLIWYYVLSSHIENTQGYDVINFPGGLYAVAVSKDKDDADGERVYSEIKQWIKSNNVFSIDEKSGHYTMFHVIKSDDVYDAIGYRQLDIFVPIKIN